MSQYKEIAQSMQDEPHIVIPVGAGRWFVFNFPLRRKSNRCPKAAKRRRNRIRRKISRATKQRQRK